MEHVTTWALLVAENGVLKRASSGYLRQAGMAIMPQGFFFQYCLLQCCFSVKLFRACILCLFCKCLTVMLILCMLKVKSHPFFSNYWVKLGS